MKEKTTVSFEVTLSFKESLNKPFLLVLIVISIENII